MKEEFLHWLWKNRLFNAASLHNNAAGTIEVISPGDYNNDSGPDFFNTRLLIDGVAWAGNTEIHLNASDWYRHGHHTDHSYDNVILHLVYNNDAETFTASGRKLLTVLLVFEEAIWDNYLDFVNNPSLLACNGFIGRLDKFRIRHWLCSLTIDRIQNKCDDIIEKLKKNQNDWEETFYILITRYFGFRVNTDPFELLARRLPLKIIRKHADNLLQVEALLFGTAGMLEEALCREAIADDYFKLLSREYNILRAKYSLQPADGWIWKYHRLRPVNFPTVRISQLAALLANSQGLFSRIVGCNNAEQLRKMLSVQASPYWNNHFVFGKSVTGSTRHAGRQSVDLLIINAAVPMLFVYGKIKQKQEYCDKALDILDTLPPEENALISDFINAGLIPESAFTTQALIELRTSWCRFHKCLECHIGSSLIALGQHLRRSDSLFLEP